ncbi:uncharacterized protein LOC120384636 [Mauremys reevesii]|uniref:uncharacterized protein LOC120384636 n=1 Tax=Mauremys reevesii TaxID=260615 RepID=UPI00193F5F0E|nr:uncharacterized protein LOC120384636 [Mauremys reevesii]
MADPRAKIKESAMVRKWLMPSLWFICVTMFFLLLLNLHDTLMFFWMSGKVNAPVTPIPITSLSPPLRKTKPILYKTKPTPPTKPCPAPVKKRLARSAEVRKRITPLTMKDIENWPWYKRRNIVHWQGGTCGIYSWECGTEWLAGFIPQAAHCTKGQVPYPCQTIPYLLSEPNPSFSTAPTRQIVPTLHPRPHQENNMTFDDFTWPRPSSISNLFSYCSTKLIFFAQGHLYQRVMEWEPLGTVRVHSINVSVYYNTTPTKTVSFMQQWGKDTDAMLFPGLCQTLNTQGTFCFLITQVTVDAVTTHRRCSMQTNFLCKETFPLTENITCTLVQFTPTHTVNETISKQGVQVHPQQLWYEPLETTDPKGFKWTILNATLGTIRFILPLTHFQIATIYPNCTRGAAIPLVLQRVWIHKSRKGGSS